MGKATYYNDKCVVSDFPQLDSTVKKKEKRKTLPGGTLLNFKMGIQDKRGWITV